MDGFSAAAHNNDDFFSILGPGIIKQVVLSADQLRELVHRLLHDCRRRIVILIDRLAALEVNIGVLSRTANHRPVRRKCVGPDFGHKFIIYHRTHIIICKLLDLLYLMAAAETIKEM